MSRKKDWPVEHIRGNQRGSCLQSFHAFETPWLSPFERGSPLPCAQRRCLNWQEVMAQEKQSAAKAGDVDWLHCRGLRPSRRLTNIQNCRRYCSFCASEVKQHRADPLTHPVQSLMIHAKLNSHFGKFCTDTNERCTEPALFSNRPQPNFCRISWQT